MLLDYSDLKNRLWRAADELRASSRLRSHEYSVPVLGLIFLRYADYKFSHGQAELAASRPSRRPSPTLPPLITLTAVAGRRPGGAGG
jgi:type I restriction enzyme M protein